MAFCTLETAQATTFIPMEIEDLARGSTAVLLGTVVNVVAVEKEDRRIVTMVDVRVDETLSGDAGTATLALQEPGGRVGDRVEVVFGAPAYAIGEEVVVFAELGDDGIWRTAHLALGKFHVERDGEDEALARQQLGHGTRALIPPGAQWRERMPLAELIRRVQAVTQKGDSETSSTRSAAAVGATVTLPGTTPNFTLQGPGRFFEVDEGMEISYLIDARGDDILGLDDARQAVGEGFNAWNDVGSANIVLVDGGLTDDLDPPSGVGDHKVRFNDPNNEISPPMRSPSDSSVCGGVLAIGGFSLTQSELKRFGGTTFGRALSGNVRFADDWDGCAAWTPCNFAEVAAHEVGHSLGLGHSSDSDPEPNPRLRDASMYFLSHFDGRCATTREDDVDGVSFIYPLETPIITITTEASVVAVAGEPNSIPLTAAGGTGSFQWAEVDIDCPAVGLRVTPDGVIEGTPNALGFTCLAARATDGNGDFHQKRFDIALVVAGSTPTPSRTATATQTRTPTATFSPVEDCIGDCNSDNNVSIDELVIALDIALGRQLPDACNGLDGNGDQQISVDELVRAVLSAIARCA